ncbi:MAG TPA: hypothetical protein VFA12_04725 [Stellaceae bacterium]|nr:hypothetical protein [Stellaceae bacterium]
MSEARPLAPAAAIRECRVALAARGGSIVGEATEGAAAIADWRHYPDGEIYDPESHAQYFYHRHPQREPREHGHFHLFLRTQGIPPGITPLLLPELAVANVAVAPQAAPVRQGQADEVCHLIAIAVDGRGEPIRLFTTNRWVTGETWYRADDVVRMLDRFRFGGRSRHDLLNCWVVAVVQLFRPQIEQLLRQRDDTVMAWRRRRRSHVFDDQRLEVVSSVEVDLDAQLAAAEMRPARRRRGPSLPRMAEGWVE